VEQIGLLKKALEDRGIPFQERTILNFEKYQKLILEWNSRVNLISKRDEERLITRHFLSSLGLVTVVNIGERSRVLDLGSGGGFPGIPLKLLRPDLEVFLVESKRKKGNFLNEVIGSLDLEGIEVVVDRAENIENKIEPVDFVVSRAVTNLSDLSRWSRGLLKREEGRLVAFKGMNLKKELEMLKKRASKLRVKGWRVSRYDPFPSVFNLKESYIVEVFFYRELL